MNDESSYLTLTDILLARASSAQSITFVEGQGRQSTVPYSELFLRAQRRLAQFQERGLKPGSQLVFQIADNDLFIEAFWACLLGGIVAVPVSGGSTSEHRHKLFRIINTLDDPGLYLEEQTHTRLNTFAAENELQQAWDALSGKTIVAKVDSLPDNQGVLHQAVASNIAFIQFSSGSTSAPKGVVLTHQNVLVNVRSIAERSLITQRDRMLSWMPLTHDMGLIGFHLTPVVFDACHYLMPADVFVRRPGLWLTSAGEERATILCSPNFGYQHVLKKFKPEKYTSLDLSSVRLIFNGAEPISVDLCNQFVQTLAPFGLTANAMYPVYGLAEASLAVAFPDVQNLLHTICISRSALGVGEPIKIMHSDGEASVTFVGVGTPLTQIEVRLSDSEDRVLADNVTGHISIRGDNVTHGYYRAPELNRSVFSKDGWLSTGDLGFMHEGQLFITGRSKDIIFVSGQNVYPHDLEELIVQAGVVQRGKLVISSQRSTDNSEDNLLVFVLHRGAPAELHDTARNLSRLLGEAAGVRVHSVVPVRRIPKTTSGKVQRYLLIEALEQGKYSQLIQPISLNENSLYADDSTCDNDTADAMSVHARLLAICNAEVVGLTVNSSDNLFELGISSLTLAQIHAAIEDVWPDQVEITDLFDYPTVSELSQFLDDKL